MIRPWTACALLLALSASTEARSVSVSCDSGPRGLSSLVIESEGSRLDVRETDSGLVVDVDDPGAALEGGALRCAPARSVQVITGRMLGLPLTRVIVSLGRERPRIVRAEGRVRLLWLPNDLGERAPSETAVAPAAARPALPAPSWEARSRPSAEAASRPAEPTPSVAPPREPPTRRPPIEAPARPARGTGGESGLPGDLLVLDRPVTMVASVGTQLREGPGRRFPPIAALIPGATITVDGRAGDWIRTTAGTWAFGPYFGAPDEALQGGAFLGRIEAINAPVHAGPAAHHEIVAELYRGEQVVIDEVKAEWAHVRDGGWVRMTEISRDER